MISLIRFLKNLKSLPGNAARLVEIAPQVKTILEQVAVIRRNSESLLMDKTLKQVVNLHGEWFTFIDHALSTSVPFITHEINHRNLYFIDKIKFNKGDVVLDIGAHIGMFSILLARKNPGIKIYSYEPNRMNYKHLVENLRLNDIRNVVPVNKAVTADGRKITIVPQIRNTGGSQMEEIHNQAHAPDHLIPEIMENIPSVTMDTIFKDHKIKNCKLLKIDCEGAEFEVLPQTKCLAHTEFLVGEAHLSRKNPVFSEQKFQDLLSTIRLHIPDDQVELTKYYYED